MPTYEYFCKNCGHKFDKFQAMSAELLKKCPKCGKRRLIRLIGAGGGIIFKGAGFHCNDYGTKKQEKENESHGVK